MADIVLDVEVRERTGTGGARDVRRSGGVPGVLYGGKLGPVAPLLEKLAAQGILAGVDLGGGTIDVGKPLELEEVIEIGLGRPLACSQPWPLAVFGTGISDNLP